MTESTKDEGQSTKPDTNPPGSAFGLRPSYLSRLGILVGIVVLAGVAWLAEDTIGMRGRAAVGVVCFLGVAALFSANLRAVNWRTVLVGLGLQVALAVFILWTPVGEQVFRAAGRAVGLFLDFTDEGSKFVFGDLMKGNESKVGFVFAFSVLPTIIFVSSFFSILYYLGVLQFVVRVFARGMMYLMGTSGAETLSATANVFMGQTEAPLIVKPYVEKMTDSELLALMIGGMATVSGGILAAAARMGADPSALLATSVMAAPCGLYLAKILLPETGDPLTRGSVRVEVERTHRNIIDAAAGGALDGLTLALNVAAVLIAFLALLAMIDYLLVAIHPALALRNLFGHAFAPVAFLLGVEAKDLMAVGDLLGLKLVANELVAFGQMPGLGLSNRSALLATFALTSFANFSSIGIQIGGIGGMAPSRRGDLARLGWTALLGGSLATLVNAALAGVLLDPGGE